MLSLIRGTAFSLLLVVCGQALADPVRDFVRAAQMDNPAVAEKLLADGLSPNTIDPVSREPVVMVALREGSTAVLKVLLAHKHLNLGLAAPNGNTALMMAALKQNKPAVETLLRRGAPVNKAGWTALHYAAAGGDAGIVTLLANEGAHIDALSPTGMTPLMMAASEGHPAALEVLLRRGADAAFRNKHGQTAREAALFRDRPDIVQAIDQHLASQGRKN